MFMSVKTREKRKGEILQITLKHMHITSTHTYMYTDDKHTVGKSNNHDTTSKCGFCDCKREWLIPEGLVRIQQSPLELIFAGWTCTADIFRKMLKITASTSVTERVLCFFREF